MGGREPLPCYSGRGGVNTPEKKMKRPSTQECTNSSEDRGADRKGLCSEAHCGSHNIGPLTPVLFIMVELGSSFLFSVAHVYYAEYILSVDRFIL